MGQNKKKIRQGIAVASVAALLSVPSILSSAPPKQVSVTWSWNDNSNNENGFRLYRRAPSDGSYQLVTDVGAGITTTTTLVTGLEGTQACFALSAYNNQGESTMTTPDTCITIPVSEIKPLPLTFNIAKTTQYAIVQVDIGTIPSNALGAAIVLTIIDADFPDEGQLYVNDFGPIPMFGSLASSANADKPATLRFEIPITAIVNNVNNLRFSCCRPSTSYGALGYTVSQVAIEFSLSEKTPIAPSGLIYKFD